IQIGKNAINNLFLEVPSTTQTRSGLGQLLFAGTETGAVAKILGETPESVKRMLKKPKVDITAIFLALVRIAFFPRSSIPRAIVVSIRTRTRTSASDSSSSSRRPTPAAAISGTTSARLGASTTSTRSGQTTTVRSFFSQVKIS